MLGTTVVIALHLDVDGNLAHTDTLHRSARQIQAVEQFARFVTASFLLLFRREFVERHLEVRINVIDHPTDDSAVCGRGNDDVTIDLGGGVRFGKLHPGMHFEGDQPLLTCLEPRAGFRQSYPTQLQHDKNPDD
jgi:hypothetical protein